MPGAEREYQWLMERYRRRRTRKEPGLEPWSVPFDRGGRGSERIRQDDARLRAVEETGSGLCGGSLPLRHPALGEGTVHLLASRTSGASILTYIFEPGDQEL